MQNKSSIRSILIANVPGISFIEILVLLMLVAIATSMVIPRFITNRPGIAQKAFFSEFSTMVADTAYQAIVTKKIHQIFWDFNNRKISVKKYKKIDGETNKHLHFTPVAPDVFTSQISLPEQFTVRNFIVSGNEEMEAGVKKNDAWFYIMPDGTSQPMVINIEDESQDKTAQFSITINPFYSQATLHDTFQNK